jgi:serine/threonine protein kinase
MDTDLSIITPNNICNYNNTFQTIKDIYNIIYEKMDLSSQDKIKEIEKVFEKILIGGKEMNYSGTFSSMFTIINKLKKGGFGTIYKAKHNIDGNEYAIKKIQFLVRSDNPEKIMNRLKEVRCMSAMNHNNIIRYNTSWIEIGNIAEEPSLSNSLSCDNLSSNDEFSNDQFSFDNSTNENSDIDPNQLQISKKSLDNLNNPSLNEYICIDIYIQMELMDISLRDYIRSDKGKIRSMNDTLLIFNSIISGVEHLHNNNIIHRDLKPANILLNIDYNEIIQNIKIADFGLVIKIPQSQYLLDNSDIGTPLYIPPESQYGTITKKYDIYSLGVIFFELILTFNTEMERYYEVNKLKNKIYKDKYPLLTQMVSENIDDRPSLEELKNKINDLIKIEI